MTTEVSACNYATSLLQFWRYIMPLHSRRTVMDNEQIFCMQSQLYITYNHSRYNKSAHEDRAVTQISPAPHLPSFQHVSINRLLLSEKEDFCFLGTFASTRHFYPLNLNSRRHQYIPVIPVNLWTIMKFSSPPHGFFDLDFHVKILCVRLLFV